MNDDFTSKGPIWTWNMYLLRNLRNRLEQMHMQYIGKWTIIFVPPCSYLFWNYVWFSSISRFEKKRWEKALTRKINKCIIIKQVIFKKFVRWRLCYQFYDLEMIRFKQKTPICWKRILHFQNSQFFKFHIYTIFCDFGTKYSLKNYVLCTYRWL